MTANQREVKNSNRIFSYSLIIYSIRLGMDPIILMSMYVLSQSKRRSWVHSINRQREKYGEYHRLVLELRLDSDRFIRYFRMTPDLFDILLSKVGPLIQKQCTNYRMPLTPAQRLSVTLR
jgi:hypothetical protein